MNTSGEFLEKKTTQIQLRTHIARSIENQVRFALATDSHFSEKEPLDDKHYSESLLKMQEFVSSVNDEDCSFAIHLGDFKDEDLIPDPESTLDYLQRMEEAFSEFRGMRFHCIGNHDLDSITKNDFLDHVENSTIDARKSYYSFEVGSVKFLVLDANFSSEGEDHFFQEGGDWERPFLPEHELRWLETELNSSSQPCIVFCHHPLFAYIKNGRSYHVVNYPDVRGILEVSGKVVAVFNGHMHEEMFHEINSIQYLAMNSMLEGTFVQRNCFYTIEVSASRLVVDRFDRINANLYS